MIYRQTLNILNNKGVATCPGMASSAGKVSYPKHISRGQGTLRMVNAQAAAEIQRARISLLGDHLGSQEFCWKFWARKRCIFPHNWLNKKPTGILRFLQQAVSP